MAELTIEQIQQLAANAAIAATQQALNNAPLSAQPIVIQQPPSLIDRAWAAITTPSEWHPAVQWGAGIAGAAALIGAGVFIGKRMFGGDD